EGLSLDADLEGALDAVEGTATLDADLARATSAPASSCARACSTVSIGRAVKVSVVPAGQGAR
ncbi:MAG: hypothetical protein ACM3PU_10820, partial [Gemmatimonadota bacterium]